MNKRTSLAHIPSRHPLGPAVGRGLPQVGPDLSVDLRPGAPALGPSGPIPESGLLAGPGVGSGPLRGAALLDRLRHPRLREAAPDRRHRHSAPAGRVFDVSTPRCGGWGSPGAPPGASACSGGRPSSGWPWRWGRPTSSAASPGSCWGTASTSTRCCSRSPISPGCTACRSWWSW